MLIVVFGIMGAVFLAIAWFVRDYEVTSIGFILWGFLSIAALVISLSLSVLRPKSWGKLHNADNLIAEKAEIEFFIEKYNNGENIDYYSLYRDIVKFNIRLEENQKSARSIWIRVFYDKSILEIEKIDIERLGK